MVKTEEREIDGMRFYVTTFPAIPALHMKARLAAVLAPALAGLVGKMDFSMFKKDSKILDMKAEELLPMIAPAITALAAALKPDEFTSICLGLMRNTIAITPEGKKVELSNGESAFNSVFSGNLETVYKAIWFVLQLNDFFGLGGIGKAAGIIARAKALLKPGSEPPKAP